MSILDCIKIKRVPITTSLGRSLIDGMLKEVCPGETVDSEAAQTKAVFFDSKGNQLSKKASRKLKEEIKLVPANHYWLLVKINLRLGLGE